jgi:hypothetical protein
VGVVIFSKDAIVASLGSLGLLTTVARSSSSVGKLWTGSRSAVSLVASLALGGRGASSVSFV